MIIFPTGLIEWSMLSMHLPQEKKIKVQRFLRRFHLAYWFEGLKVSHLDDNTIEGYNALFSVFLSFSAYELLWESLETYYESDEISTEKYQLTLLNVDLAEKLKHDTKLKAFLHLEDSNNYLTKRVKDFFESDDIDLIPILSVMKDKVAHGFFSIGGMTPESKEHSRDIWNASRELLVLTEDLFHNFVLAET